MPDESSFDGKDDASQPGETLPDRYEVRITGSREALAKVLREFDLDIGCRHPRVETNPNDTVTLLAYATDDRIRELQAAGYSLERGENVSALGRARQSEVGAGDRFEGGRRAPSGLGEKRRPDGKGRPAS